MNKNNLYFTLGEFAKLHGINKRTLHYYDDIALFSPDHKGENGYRYYTYKQSMELVTILSFREIGMSIKEIQRYFDDPTTESFISLADMKVAEIDKTIKRLMALKKMFLKNNELLNLSQTVLDEQIDVVELGASYLFMTAFPVEFDDTDDESSVPTVLEHLKSSWDISTFKISCGSFISLEKIIQEDFEYYDGLFTEIDTYKKNLYTKPKGKYLRGFSVGDWDKLPNLYRKMMAFAEENSLQLGEYAFERGINEVSSSNSSEYITEVTIYCKEMR